MIPYDGIRTMSFFRSFNHKSYFNLLVTFSSAKQKGESFTFCAFSILKSRRFSYFFAPVFRSTNLFVMTHSNNWIPSNVYQKHQDQFVVKLPMGSQTPFSFARMANHSKLLFVSCACIFWKFIHPHFVVNYCYTRQLWKTKQISNLPTISSWLAPSDFSYVNIQSTIPSFREHIEV